MRCWMYAARIYREASVSSRKGGMSAGILASTSDGGGVAGGCANDSWERPMICLESIVKASMLQPDRDISGQLRILYGVRIKIF